PAPAKPAHAVGGLIGEKYRQLGGPAGALGRPTSDEIEVKSKNGRFQHFEHGMIGWTPSTGPKSVQALYVKDHEIVFEWGDTSPFDYDIFLVRWDLNGTNVGQDEIRANPRTGGRWTQRPSRAGRYRVMFEGGIKHTIGGSKFHQGWSNGLEVDYL